MDKLVKFAITIGALLASISVFYHYVVALPSIERDKAAEADLARREKATAAHLEQLRETQRQRAYDGCISIAAYSYRTDWAAACKSFSMQQDVAYKNCLGDKAVIANQFLGESYCKSTFGDSDASPECSLPSERAQSINVAHKQAQEKCVTEARLGLQ